MGCNIVTCPVACKITIRQAHAPEEVQNLSALVPGRELRENMAQYAQRVQDFKQQFPDFEKYVRDEIFRQQNGPDVALFHLQPGELCESDIWNSHKSSPKTKEQKPRKVVKPPKQA